MGLGKTCQTAVALQVAPRCLICPQADSRARQLRLLAGPPQLLGVCAGCRCIRSARAAANNAARVRRPVSSHVHQTQPLPKPLPRAAGARGRAADGAGHRGCAAQYHRLVGARATALGARPGGPVLHGAPGGPQHHPQVRGGCRRAAVAGVTGLLPLCDACAGSGGRTGRGAGGPPRRFTGPRPSCVPRRPRPDRAAHGTACSTYRTVCTVQVRAGQRGGRHGCGAAQGLRPGAPLPRAAGGPSRCARFAVPP